MSALDVLPDLIDALDQHLLAFFQDLHDFARRRRGVIAFGHHDLVTLFDLHGCTTLGSCRLSVVGRPAGRHGRTALVCLNYTTSPARLMIFM